VRHPRSDSMLDMPEVLGAVWRSTPTTNSEFHRATAIDGPDGGPCLDPGLGQALVGCPLVMQAHSRPLQNRVTPFGEIVAIAQRGTFIGNRGIIHDPATKTLLRKRCSTKAWLVCLLHYKGRRREVMSRRSLDRALFPRRGSGARRRSSALFLLSSRGCGAIPRRLDQGQGRGGAIGPGD
jgi:hypothetical protein